MNAEQRSATAEGAAAMRALGCYDPNPELRNPDNLAEQLVGPKLRRWLASRPARWLARTYFHHALPGLYEGHLARSHHFDRVVLQALESGVQQYLILAAGLDSRTVRFRDSLDSCQAFEVDHPATAAFKQQRLASMEVDVAHVNYVPCDFEVHDLEQQLVDAHFDMAKPTIVTWEGVSMYLTRQAVSRIIGLVSAMGPGSSIVFDYQHRSAYEHPERFRHARRHFAYVERVGEPYTFGLDPEEVAGFVSERGLTLRSNLDAEDMARLYLTEEHDIPAWYAVAHAFHS